MRQLGNVFSHKSLMEISKVICSKFGSQPEVKANKCSNEWHDSFKALGNNCPFCGGTFKYGVPYYSPKDDNAELVEALQSIKDILNQLMVMNPMESDIYKMCEKALSTHGRK